MASLGDAVRSMASVILRVDTNDRLLRALGIDSPELELGRESFVTVWRKYDFRVKTFREAWGIRGLNIGPMNDKVGLLLAERDGFECSLQDAGSARYFIDAR